MIDIPTTLFLALRKRFFNPAGEPVQFALRPKANTQDDPFDEHLATDVLASLPGIQCEKASALITPDIALFRPDLCSGASTESLRDDLTKLVAFEVKKVERTPGGSVARASGLDYNTTPPCGRMRVYDRVGSPLDVRGFYIFVCQEAEKAALKITALAVVDGNLLNTDFDFYLSIVGERQKRIGLGSYGDGADRDRPMLIFSNPLGVQQFARGACLIHPSSDLEITTGSALKKVHAVRRKTSSTSFNEFHVYRAAADATGAASVTTLNDPLPTPTRETKTRTRGRFKLPFRT